METIGASLPDLKDYFSLLTEGHITTEKQESKKLIDLTPVPETSFMKIAWETEAILVIKDEILYILLKTENMRILAVCDRDW